jgi:hypothetical protein
MCAYCDPTLIVCVCPVDHENEPIPSRDCELHWRQVILNADLPPKELYP